MQFPMNFSPQFAGGPAVQVAYKEIGRTSVAEWLIEDLQCFPEQETHLPRDELSP